MARYRRGAALLTLAALGGCLESASVASSTDAPICHSTDTVRITTTLGTVNVGATQPIAFVTSAASITCIRWSSSNDFIARVSSGGIIQGLAVGRVTITAQAAARTDSTVFTVVAPASANR